MLIPGQYAGRPRDQLLAVRPACAGPSLPAGRPAAPDPGLGFKSPALPLPQNKMAAGRNWKTGAPDCSELNPAVASREGDMPARRGWWWRQAPRLPTSCCWAARSTSACPWPRCARRTPACCCLSGHTSRRLRSRRPGSPDSCCHGLPQAPQMLPLGSRTACASRRTALPSRAPQQTVASCRPVQSAERWPRMRRLEPGRLLAHQSRQLRRRRQAQTRPTQLAQRPWQGARPGLPASLLLADADPLSSCGLHSQASVEAPSTPGRAARTRSGHSGSRKV